MNQVLQSCKIQYKYNTNVEIVKMVIEKQLPVKTGLYKNSLQFNRVVSQSTVVLCIGMDEVLVHYTCTFENSDLHFSFQ